MPYSAENMIPFIDLAAQQKHIRRDIDKAIQAVLDHGQYIMGPEVRELEDQLAEFTGVKHAVSTSSGTDALILCLMALGLKPGDGVIVPSFSFAASAEVMPCLGAIPIFADVDPNHLPLILPDLLMHGRRQIQPASMLWVLFPSDCLASRRICLPSINLPTSIIYGCLMMRHNLWGQNDRAST